MPECRLPDDLITFRSAVEMIEVAVWPSPLPDLDEDDPFTFSFKKRRLRLIADLLTSSVRKAAADAGHVSLGVYPNDGKAPTATVSYKRLAEAGQFVTVAAETWDCRKLLEDIMFGKHLDEFFVSANDIAVLTRHRGFREGFARKVEIERACRWPDLAAEIAAVNEGIEPATVLKGLWVHFWNGSIGAVYCSDNSCGFRDGTFVIDGGWYVYDPSEVKRYARSHGYPDLEGRSTERIKSEGPAAMVEIVKKDIFDQAHTTVEASAEICRSMGWTAPAFLPLPRPKTPRERFEREMPSPIPADELAFWREEIAGSVVAVVNDLGFEAGTRKLAPYCVALSGRERGFGRRVMDGPDDPREARGPLHHLVRERGWEDNKDGKAKPFDHYRLCAALGISPDDPLLGRSGKPMPIDSKTSAQSADAAAR